MTLQGLFERLVAALNTADVPYMLTGSYASSAYGRPRATQDIDIVIFPTRDQLVRLIEQLPNTSYYATIEEAIDALRHRSMFNIIDFETGWKVDFIIPKFTEFNEEEFERRREIEVGGVRLFVASPEDIVIAKLQWAKESQSERQLEDAAGVISSQASKLNRAYIERWVRKLGLQEEWLAASAKAV